MRSTEFFTGFLKSMGVDESFTLKRCSRCDTYYKNGCGFGIPRFYYHVNFKNGKPKRMKKGV